MTTNNLKGIFIQMSHTDKYHDFTVEDWHYISSFLEYSDIIEID